MNKIKKKLLKYSATTIFEERDELEFEYFSSTSGRLLSKNGVLGWHPQYDLFETDKYLVVVLDIANMDQTKIKILFKDDNLIIKGFRKECEEQNRSHYHKLEIDFGPFERVITLPIKVDKKNIIKEYKNGFYKIKLTKE